MQLFLVLLSTTFPILSTTCAAAVAAAAGEYNTSIGLEIATMAHDVLSK
jgi:hypothetical protein